MVHRKAGVAVIGKTQYNSYLALANLSTLWDFLTRGDFFNSGSGAGVGVRVGLG